MRRSSGRAQECRKSKPRRTPEELQPLRSSRVVIASGWRDCPTRDRHRRQPVRCFAIGLTPPLNTPLASPLFYLQTPPSPPAPHTHPQHPPPPKPPAPP